MQANTLSETTPCHNRASTIVLPSIFYVQPPSSHPVRIPAYERTSSSTTLSVISNASDGELFAFSGAPIALSALARSMPKAERAAQ